MLAVPGADAAGRGLGRAAMALDGTAVTALLIEALERDGVLVTYERLMRPVLVAIGDRWSLTGQGVEVEHLLSECIAAVMRARTVAGPAGPRLALLACADQELHSVPLQVLGGALADLGIASRLLGAAVPPDALTAAVRRIGPAALFVWSQLAETGSPEQLQKLPRTRPRVTVLVGGAGWAVERLPPAVMFCPDLRSAVAGIGSATGAGGSMPPGS